jgi:hypothetical protein
MSEFRMFILESSFSINSSKLFPLFLPRRSFVQLVPETAIISISARFQYFDDARSSGWAKPGVRTQSRGRQMAFNFFPTRTTKFSPLQARA